MIPLILAGLAAAKMGGEAASGYFQKKATEKMTMEQLHALDRAMGERREAYEDVAPMWSPYQQAGEGSLTQLLSGLDSGAYETEVPEFAYGGTVDQFLDPSIAYQMQRGQEMLGASAAPGGGLMSGAMLKDLQERGMQLGAQDYGAAFGRMQSDKSQAYQQFSDQFARQQSENQARFNRLSNMVNLGTTAAGALTGARTGMGQALAEFETQKGNIAGIRAAANDQMLGGMMSSLANTSGMVGSMMGGMGGGAAGGAAGAGGAVGSGGAAGAAGMMGLSGLSGGAPAAVPSYAAPMQGYSVAPMQNYVPNYNRAGVNSGNLGGY